MEAIILAGGLGTRLRSLVPDLPKPMATVAGRPFLDILLTSLANKGFSRIILSLGYLADKVTSHFGSDFAGMELIYEIEPYPLGTGGAIKGALNRCLSDHVFVMNGDTFLELESAEIESQWSRCHNPIIVAREVSDTTRYGRLDVIEGRVTGFLDKGITGPGLINAGCYVLPRDILDVFEPGKAFSLESDFLVSAVMQKHFDVFVTRGRFIDIGVPDDYVRAQTELADTLNLQSPQERSVDVPLK